MSIYIDGGDFIGRMEKWVSEFDDDLVPEESPFGDYYVPRAKRDRSRELKETLDELNRDFDRRYQRDQQDRANTCVDMDKSE